MPFDKKVIGFGLAALAALTSLILAIIVVAGIVLPTCERVWSRDVPGANAVASVWRSNCGATTPYTTGVMVTASSTRRFELGKVVYGVREQELKIEWEGDTLFIGGPRDGIRTDHIRVGGQQIRVDVRR